MSRIEVIREGELLAGDSTNGIYREKAFESPGLTVSRSRVPAAVSSGWHPHGERHLYGFLVAGQLRLEYGPRGVRAAEVGSGDFFHIPPRLVHRDVNPSRDEDSIVINVLAGRGTLVINVEGPESR